MSECHLFGNGPSHKAAPSTPIEHSYGCNIRIKDRPVKAVGCIDSGYTIKRLVEQTKADLDGTCIYVATSTYRHLSPQLKKASWIQKVLEVGWSTETRLNFNWNCGQVMSHFLSTRYEVVNLWGFDSLSNPHTYSWHHDLPDADLCQIRPTFIDQQQQHEDWMVGWQKLVSDLGHKTIFVNNMPSPNGTIKTEVLNDLFTNLRM
jgi:hypothetical protein